MPDRSAAGRGALNRRAPLSLVCLLLLLVCYGSAQLDARPAWLADSPTHPPVCPGAKPVIRSTTARLAEQEQEAGRADVNAILAREPLENFGIERYRVAAYADCSGESGCYWADVDAQYQRAEHAFAGKLAEYRQRPKPQVPNRQGEKLAIVMDIDETALSGYCEMKREDYGFIGSMFNRWVVTPDASLAIPGALRLFAQAKAAGVAVFFITGRPGQPSPEPGVQPAPDQTEATASNLKLAGYEGWKGLALRNGAENTMATITYKSAERAKIVAAGYRILLSVGDQWSDLLGDPQAEVSVKLPNPFYFIP